MRHLPLEAVLSDNDGWSLSDQLASDLIFVQSGHHHPADPRVAKPARMKKQRLAEAAERAALRRNELGITGSVI